MTNEQLSILLRLYADQILRCLDEVKLALPKEILGEERRSFFTKETYIVFPILDPIVMIAEDMKRDSNLLREREIKQYGPDSAN
jgi:hypothetical protein